LPPEVEIIVSIDGSTDNTASIVSRFQQSCGQLKFVFYPNGGRSVVRNRGAEIASGDIFIFYDDDMEPATGSVARHVSFHEQHVGLCAGMQVDRYSSGNRDVMNYKAWMVERWMKKFPQNISAMEAKNLFFSAANCSIRKEHFKMLSGFDPRLRDNEDYDLALRAIDAGLGVYLDPANIAVHHDDITARRYIQRLNEYQAGKQRLSELNPERFKRAQAPAMEPKWKKLVYHVLSGKIFIEMIDSQILKYLLPQSIRYRLYAAVFHAALLKKKTTDK
jgi:glycosyltransferase involved in cell wall biosynthesis